MERFRWRESHHFALAYMMSGGEKEYYLAEAFEEVYIPSSAKIRAGRFSISGEV